MNDTTNTPPAIDTDGMPHWRRHHYVARCLEWHQQKHGGVLSVQELSLEARGWPEDEALTVGIAMRDPDLLACYGFTIREAWQALAWPGEIDAIRREVVWILSERAREERDREAGSCDLFDALDPSRAPKRLRRARSAVRECTAGDDAAGAELALRKVRLYEASVASGVDGERASP